MGVWIAEHWFELLQTVGIVGSLSFTAYTTHRAERAREIGNSIAISEQHRQNWSELYERPKLARVLAKDLDLNKEPVSTEETLFVTTLILHLSTVYRAMKHDEFVKLEGLQRDVAQFLSLPIPSAVWEKIKTFQDDDLVQFIEACLREK